VLSYSISFTVYKIFNILHYTFINQIFISNYNVIEQLIYIYDIIPSTLYLSILYISIYLYYRFDNLKNDLPVILNLLCKHHLIIDGTHKK